MSDESNLPEHVEPDAVSGDERDPLGMLGGIDMGSILDVAQSMQSQMMEAQAKLAAAVVEGQAGGGVVRIEVTGQVEFRSVHIDAQAVDPDDPSLLEDLVLAALHDAIAKLNALQEETSPLGGLDLGDLGDMFGGGRGVSDYPLPLQELIDTLGRLPGVGPKSAQRIAFWLLAAGDPETTRLADALREASERISLCERCFNLAEGPECPICTNPARDGTVICVVEEPRDVVAIERTREFKGRYHVLGGAIDHLKGVGPEQLRIGELVRRLTDEGVVEVILATNPNIEGEMTALYLTKVLDAPGLMVSKLSSGLPVGGDLEYADEMTLGRALEGRRLVERATS